MNKALNLSEENVYLHKDIGNRLQRLGYNYSVLPCNTPLHDNLIKELLIAKEELKQYKLMIKKVEKEKLDFEKALIPYQQDNGRLALENNDLQEQLFVLKQEYQNEQQNFRKQQKASQLRITDLEFMCRVAVERVRVLEQKNGKFQLGDKNSVKTDCEKESSTIKNKTKNNVMKSRLNEMDKKTTALLAELDELKFDNQHQADIIAALRSQVTQKDREICRIRHTLEGGRALSAVTRDCCQPCKQKDSIIKSLEEQLEEALEKQHEAMNRALHLAERNQHLERELKDIDNMALAVEAECHNKVKHNLRNMDIVEERLLQKTEEIKELEDVIRSLKCKIQQDDIDLENLKREKESLEKNLHAATGEKKQLNDKINYFLLIEKNLNSEITRMQEINKSLQRQICDMEKRVLDILGTTCKSHLNDKQKKQNINSGLPGSKIQTASNSVTSTKVIKGCKKYKEEEHNECFHQSSCASLLNKIQQERDFYHNECHRLKDQLGSIPFKTDRSSELIIQIKELEKKISDLKHDNFILRQENSTNFKRLECNEHLSCSSGDSLKIILDRLEKERDMALSDISRLQGERDALKERMKLATENHICEQARFEKIMREYEERIRRLESERRELISTQSSQRMALANMEEKCDEYKDSIRKAQGDCAQMKANYGQLKILQEQTDRSLSDIQNHHAKIEFELRVATTKLQDSERINGNLENEIRALKQEKTNLLSNVTFIEKEKDGLVITLDEKTEKVAKLETHVKTQENHIADLKEKLSHLEKKFELTLNEKTNREYNFRSLEREVERLKEEIEQYELQKQALVRENRRLQDDLAAATKDCLTARRELDIDKQDVENLKKQLQQYVTEVKKAEELLTKKESERNQMLEHFRSLSIEATNLESNNHTLESTVENTKIQLISANNRILDLEHEISSKETLLYNYEKQIADLTGQVAELESKLKLEVEMRAGAEEDLVALRDLCSTLDGQKEALTRQADNSDAEKVHLINEVRRLSEEFEGLNQKLAHEKSLSQTLEKSLTNSRQETLEHKITNKDLKTHVQHLQQKVDELTQRLEMESQDVRRYQSQCAELSHQVSELRREVTNARFEHAKTKEDSTKRLFYGKPLQEKDSQNNQCSDQHHNTPSLSESNASDEEVKERSFEGKLEGNKSYRNIPLLTLPDDSDRTVSLDSENDNLKYLFEEIGSEMKRPYWKLSPVIEKFEGKSDSNTASELSSLPEDSDGRNALNLNIVSPPTEENTENADFPTYSIRTRLSNKMEDYSSGVEEIQNCYSPSNMDHEQAKLSASVGVHGNQRRCKVSFQNLREFDASCSEQCEFNEIFWNGTSTPEDEKNANVQLESPSSLNTENLKHLTNPEDHLGIGNTLSEIDEKTFSLEVS